jgi:hypothetical protein
VAVRLSDSMFDLGERVHIDGDRSISAVVVAVTFRGNNVPDDEQHQVVLTVAWFVNGGLHEHAIEDWRVTRVED